MKEGVLRTEHDISGADEKDVEVIASWNEGRPVCERIDRRSSTICEDHAPIHSNQPGRVDRALSTRRVLGRPTPGRGVVAAKRRDVERERHRCRWVKGDTGGKRSTGVKREWGEEEGEGDPRG